VNGKSFEYIKNASEDEGVILLYQPIGNYIDKDGNLCYGISGSNFAYEMQYLADRCKKISVRINSIGGNVIDAYSIISSILNCKVPVNTFIDGIAASSAGVIAVSGKVATIMDYGCLMLHNPSGSEDKAVLALVKSNLVTILTNRTSKTAEEISALMDVETWLSAEEALNSGFVDKIQTSNKKIKMPVEKNLYNMAFVYNSLLQTNTKPMNKITNKLGLDEGSSEEKAVSEIEKIQSENADLKKRLADIEDEQAKKKEEAEAAELLAATNKATELIQNGVKEGKITSEVSEKYIQMAIKDFDFVENALKSMTAVKNAAKIFDPKKVKDVDQEKTFAELQKENPKLLQKMYVENRAEYDALLNAHLDTIKIK